MSLLCSTYLDMADQQTWQSQCDFTASRSLQNCRTFCFYLFLTFRFFNLQQRVLLRFSWPIGLQSTALSHSKTFFQLRLSLTRASLPQYSSIPCSPWIPMDSHGHTSRNALVRCARMTWACDDVWLISIHIFLSTPEIKMSKWSCPKPKGPSPHSNITMIKKNRYLAVTGQTFCLDLYHFCHPTPTHELRHSSAGIVDQEVVPAFAETPWHAGARRLPGTRS